VLHLYPFFPSWSKKGQAVWPALEWVISVARMGLVVSQPETTVRRSGPLVPIPDGLGTRAVRLSGMPAKIARMAGSCIKQIQRD